MTDFFTPPHLRRTAKQARRDRPDLEAPTAPPAGQGAQPVAPGLLGRCEACAAAVSRRAGACPRCGHPVASRAAETAVLFAILFAAFNLAAAVLLGIALHGARDWQTGLQYILEFLPPWGAGALILGIGWRIARG